MPDYCTCGAQLPPDARFCHKCGKPQYDYPEPEEAQPQPPPVIVPPPLPPSAVQGVHINLKNRSAVRVGFIVALLSVVLILFTYPLVQTAWLFVAVFFLAGLVATVWYKGRTGQRLSMAGGVRIGWITGIFCFVLWLILLTLVVVALVNANSLPELRDNPNFRNPNIQEVLQLFKDPGKATMFIIAYVIAMFIVVTTLPMLGGALGAKISDKRV